MMAEGGYDPTTENENPILDHTLDNDDDDDDTTAPRTPGASSTPYHPGAPSTPYHHDEEHEMTHLPQEQSEVVHGPGEPEWKALTHIFPDASATDLEAFIDPITKRLMVRIKKVGKASYYLLTEDPKTKQEHLNPRLSLEIRKALGKSALEQLMPLQQEKDRNLRGIVQKRNQLKQMEETAQEVQERKQDLENLRNRTRQLDDKIRELEDKAGPLDEEAIQRLKDEKRAMEAEHQRKRAQFDQAEEKAKQALQLQVEINDLKLANRDIDKQINRLGIKPTRSLYELELEKAELEKRVADGKRVLEDENASPSDKVAAQRQVEQDERALERIQ